MILVWPKSAEQNLTFGLHANLCAFPLDQAGTEGSGLLKTKRWASDISQVFGVDDILGVLKDIQGNRQGENTIRFRGSKTSGR